MQQAIVSISMIIVLAFAFYAIKLLASFRSGMLEKSWKQVAIGAVLLIFAQMLFVLSGEGFPNIISFLSTAATLTRFAAMVFIILGMRSHYQIWRLDNKTLEKGSEPAGVLAN
ncbi:MAG: hypothetical protein M1368_03995 [Thaumarchaeota archaeon]|nr:hypothetical protein [Nitrososphaerota archaeon]